MNAITLINVALHVLMLSVLGWGMVRWCIADARHRAWASLLVLMVALIAPLIMELEFRAEVTDAIAEEAPAAAVTNWKPDWKISTSFAPPASGFPETIAEAPAAALWSLADVARWTCVAWIAGSVVVALLLVTLSLAAWRWRRSLRPPTVMEMDLLPSSASRYALRVSEGEACPCVVGLWQPVIAVPRRIIGIWTPRQWTWLLRHEGEHVRNRDTLTAWLLGWIKALVWWNPFVHALVEQWSQAREEICDRAALTGEQESAAYSEFLLDIAAVSRSSTPVLLHMAASRPARRLRARMVAMLARRRVRERASRTFQLGALITMTAVAAMVSCFGLKAEDALAPGFPKTDHTAAQDAAELVTRSYKVAPDFLTSGKELSAGRMTALQILQQRGIDFPEGATAVFVPATSQLVVRNTKPNLDRIALALESLMDEREVRNTQVHVTTKWIELDAPKGPAAEDAPGADAPIIPPVLPEILTDAQYQVLLRALAQTKGVDLMVAPSVTTRIGQRAAVEVTRDFYSKEAAEAAAKGLTSPGPDFIGPRLEVQVELEGDRLKLQVSGDLGELDKTDPANPRVRHLRQSRTASIRDGETLLLEMGESPTNKGRRVLLSVTANLIDPRGHPVGADEAVQRTRRTELLKKEEATAASLPPQVGFDIGEKDLAPGDDIVIEKVFCSSPDFAAGDRVVVKGRYKLASAADAKICLFLTAAGSGGRSPVAFEQTSVVERGTGIFELAQTIQTEGRLHVSFYPTKGGSDLGGVYFGKGKQAVLAKNSVARNDTATPADTRPVDVSVWLVELRHGKNEEAFQVATDAIRPAPASEEEVAIPPDGTLSRAMLVPGLYTLSGVVTPAQVEMVKSALIKRTAIKTNALPAITTTSGTAATFKDEGGLSVEAAPVIGPDGLTVDLQLVLKAADSRASETGKAVRNITTTVTVWDGQTVIMGAIVSEDEKSRLSRLVFITPSIKK